MGVRLTTRAQVSGYRFLLRRVEHALVRRDARMLDDPMRAQSRSLLVGTVVAVLIAAGFGVYGLIRPQGRIGDAPIVAGADRGGLYVDVDGTLHPVPDLTSARLVVGKAASPTRVAESVLARRPRGPALGILGAPADTPGPAGSGAPTWAACDTPADAAPTASRAVTTTVLAAAVDLPPAPEDVAVLAAHGSDVHLLRGSTRALVRLDDPVVVEALGLVGVRPRPVSAGVLSAFDDVGELSRPTAERGSVRLGATRIAGGDVVATTAVDGSRSFFVARADGLAPIGQVAAEVALAAANQAAPVEAALADVATARRTAAPELAAFPPRRVRAVEIAASPVVCFAWRDGPVGLAVASRLPLASDRAPVRLASADGAGPATDAVYVTPGTGWLVQATGSERDSPRRVGLAYVADTGVRYGLPDSATATMLGLRDPRPAPWAVLALLPSGPELSRANALVARDVVVPIGGLAVTPSSGAAPPG